MTELDIEIIAFSNDFIPKKSYESDACFDLCAAKEVMISSKGQALIPCGFQMNIPSGWAAYLWSRSGLAVDRGLDIGAGVIDAGYQGEIHALIFNHNGNHNTRIDVGDRIAQMQFVEVPKVKFRRVPEFDLTSDRADSGFGSTGV